MLVCALCAFFASPAFAWTGSMWLTPQYPVVPPTPPSPAAAALLAGSSIKAQDGWEQVTCTGTPYADRLPERLPHGRERRPVHLAGRDRLQLSHLALGHLRCGHPHQGLDAIADECKAGVAMWPLIPVEYQQELQGIADGMAAWYQAEGLVCPDNLWDVVADNAWADLSTYTTGGTITANTAASPTVITTAAPNGLVSGMSVTIACSNSSPSINGTYTVTVIDSTHFSIPVAVTTAGSKGTFTTASPPPIPASPTASAACDRPRGAAAGLCGGAGGREERQAAPQVEPNGRLQRLRRQRSRLDHGRHAGDGPRHVGQLGPASRQLHVLHSPAVRLRLLLQTLPGATSGAASTSTRTAPG